jgi:hypothetical protein
MAEVIVFVTSIGLNPNFDAFKPEAFIFTQRIIQQAENISFFMVHFVILYRLVAIQRKI